MNLCVVVMASETRMYKSAFFNEIKRMRLKMMLLMKIKFGEVYTYGILKDFKKSGFVDFYGPSLKNDTYNTIKTLEKAGYIKVSSMLEGGRVKKYYILTKKGNAILSNAKKTMMAAMKEVNRLFR